MNDTIVEDPAAIGDPASENTVVTLVIPRRHVRIGLILIVLVIVNLGIGMFAYRLIENHSATIQNGPENIQLPPPVTFIAPTEDPRTETTRFSVSLDDDPSRGSLSAPVVIIEFSDYQCRSCGIFARETLHPLLELYSDQIRFVYRDFLVYGPVSLQAAVAAECANEQNAFWPYHNLLFEFQDELSRERMIELALSIDLDIKEFSTCLENPVMEEEVKADTEDGLSLSVRGTPTFFINGRILVGAAPLETFTALIDEELAAAGFSQETR